MSDFTVEIAQRILTEDSWDSAAKHAEKWVKDHPDSCEALQFYGLVYAKKPDIKTALTYFKRALHSHPQEISCHINISNAYTTLGEIEPAIQHLHQALRLDPRHAEAYNNLGRLYYKQGLTNEAVSYLEKALRLNPNYWEAHYNLAHSLVKQNQMNRAATHYQEVIRLQPSHPTAHYNLGLIYLEEEQYPLAETHLNRACTLNADNVDPVRLLGQVYIQLGQPDNAMDAFKKALALSPTLADVHHNLAILYLGQGNRPEALNHFQIALSEEPQNETARHMVTALSGNETSDTAPTQYVTQLFDQYADYYDDHLKKKLKYQAPYFLRTAIGQCLKDNSTSQRVLDLGCGTGMCGIFFRDLALELIGVDLSPKMLEKAKILGAYDQLFPLNYLEYLSNESLEPFHIIIAADVFVYTGDLAQTFALVAKKLSPTGLFAFTIENLERGTFSLQPTGRFSHHQTYIQKLADNHQLKMVINESIVLREQEDNPIAGQLYVLTPMETH